MLANGASFVPSPVASLPVSLDTNTPSSFVVQHAASSATSPLHSEPPPPPSPALPLLPLAPWLPPLLEPAPEPPPSLPAPPPDALPALPATGDAPALPHDAVALQSSAELLQPASCDPTRPKPKPNAKVEKALIRITVAPTFRSSPTR